MQEVEAPVTIELFRTITPYVTVLLVVVVGIIGFFLKWLVHLNDRNHREIKEKIALLERETRELDKKRQADLKYMFEEYVSKESFYLAVGKMDGLISRIFDQLNELNRSVNQVIGALSTHGKDTYG